MKIAAVLSRTLWITATTFALISAAQASSTRTFINTVIGNDGNSATNCAATAPCKTLAVAYGVTNPGGEVVAMTPGGYGPVSITGPISILGTEGATLTASSGVTAVTVNTANATDKVYINNIQITGANNANSTGIALTKGELILTHSALKYLTTGLVVTNSHADLLSVDFVGNGTAIQTNGAGVAYNINVGIYIPGPATTVVRINGGNYVDNTTVFNENNPTATSSNPTATIWYYQVAPFMTGYTTLMTITGTGSGGNDPGPQGFSGTGTPPG